MTETTQPTRPSWDEYFLSIAEMVSRRSPDPNTKHGCVIVDSGKRILSTGYNGPV
ncbi:MAG: cell division protein DedD, partial [bacterium]